MRYIGIDLEWNLLVYEDDDGEGNISRAGFCYPDPYNDANRMTGWFSVYPRTVRAWEFA